MPVPTDALSLARRLLAVGPDAPYHLLDGTTAEELVAGHLSRVPLLSAAGTPLVAQLYRRIGDLGGHLWEQDVRTLLRTSALGHPALPDVRDGGYDPNLDVGYIVTSAADYTMADAAAIGYMRAHPIEALRHLLLLADGLAVIHSQGFIHRNLTPAAVNVRRSGDDLVLELARFEMSAFISNLARGSGGARLAAQLRDATVAQADEALAHLPPERLDAVLADGVTDYPETDRGDVFGLGVMAATWFLGNVAVDRAGVVDRRRSRLQLAQRDLVAAVTRAEQRNEVPAALADVLRGMLDTRPDGRPTAAQVVTALTRNYSAIADRWTPGSDSPHLVVYIPQEFHHTAWQWRWIVSDPRTEVGRRELADWLEEELSGARLVWSEQGAERFVESGELEARRAAKYVLIGAAGAWFCAPFREQGPFGGLSEPWDEALLIKFVAPLERTRGRLDNARFARDAPPIEPLPIEPISRLQQERAVRPSWRPLIESTKAAGERPPWEDLINDALSWIVDYREATSRAQQYPYEIVASPPDGGGGGRTAIRVDGHERRFQISRGEGLLTYVASEARWPSMGDYFDDLRNVSETGALKLECTSRDDRRSRVELELLERADADTVIVRSIGRSAIPPKGWVRPKDAFLDDLQLRKEATARDELMQSKGLLAQLERPFTIEGLERRWREAGRDLEGEGAAIVREMLVSQPFYALQGPPGTGKTTVTASAVDAYVRGEPTARVLVSAQSNAALDNLAISIRNRFTERGHDVLMLRVASAERRKAVDVRLRPLMLDAVVQSQERRIRQEVQRRLAREEDADRRRIMAAWLDALPTSKAELSERIRKGATVVFATCNMATAEHLADGGLLPAFDWVVVEEAAKAWPTELAIPLVRGLRWTLVGDHHQLGAHRRDEVATLFHDFVASGGPYGDRLAGRQAEIVQVFDLFARVFAQAATSARPPVNRLTRQFRMRADIAEVVSRAFYPDGGTDHDGLPTGRLETAPSAEARRSGLTEPRVIAERPLVWIDTSGSDMRDELCWSNPKEAEYIARLVARLKPQPATKDLVILTPYLAQVDALGRCGLAPQTHTIHSFQGNEASIVVVSLVRTTARRGGDLRASLGFVTRADVVNVLLSRARAQLIVVGNFDHFEGAGDTTWSVVLPLIRRFGALVPYDSPSLGLVDQRP